MGTSINLILQLTFRHVWFNITNLNQCLNQHKENIYIPKAFTVHFTYMTLYIQYIMQQHSIRCQFKVKGQQNVQWPKTQYHEAHYDPKNSLH